MSRATLMFLLVTVVICVGVGVWTAYALYREDGAQTAASQKVIACAWEPGTDDSGIPALGVIGWMMGVNFIIAALWTGLLMWLVASRAIPWLIVCAGLLAAVFMCDDVSKAWMFPIMFGGTFGAIVNMNLYGRVGKQRRRSCAQSV